MNVLYSAEQKCQPLGSQALTDRRTDVQKVKKKLELFDVTAISVLQKIRKKFKSLKLNISRIVSSLAKTGARTFDQNFV